MKLTMLGTGMAMVTACYNTCFVLQEREESMLVDGGGGNGVLVQLAKAGIDWKSIRHIFITHKHIDHIMGILWVIRKIGQGINRGDYDGCVQIYGHDEVILILQNMADALLQDKIKKYIGSRIIFQVVKDAESRQILGHTVTFFDILSTKDKQYGFTIEYTKGKRLTCCGDEPYNNQNSQYVTGSDWLMLEAFCMCGEAELFQPYEKHHSTVKEACEQAEALHIPNLILYHTEDTHMGQRKRLYRAEGRQYYHGNLCVPDDLEHYTLDGEEHRDDQSRISGEDR